MGEHVSIEGEYRYAKIPIAMLHHREIDAQAIAVWSALWCFSDAEDRSCFPSRKKVAALAGVSVDTVDRRIKTMRKLKLITVEHRKTIEGDYSSNKYFLHPTALDAEGGNPAAESSYPAAETPN